MRLIKWFLIGFFLAITVGFVTAQAYTVGEIPPDSDVFITLENAPTDYDIFNPPQIEVSRFADFSDSAIGNFVAVLWDLESLEAAEIRLGREFPEITQLNKYVFFMIEQADKPIEYRPPLPNGMVDPEATQVSLSWGWQYARYVTDANTEQCSTVDYFTGSGTTQAQLLGLITQMDNLVSNGGDAGKVLRSVADLYGKVEEVKNELSVMRSIVDDAE